MSILRPDSSIPIRVLFKRFALIYLVIIAVFSIAVLLSIHLDEQRRLDRLEVREKSRIEIARSLLVQDFAMVDSNLRVTASLISLQRYLESGDSSVRDELTQFFYG